MMFQRTISMWRRWTGQAPSTLEGVELVKDRRRSARLCSERAVVCHRVGTGSGQASGKSGQLRDVSSGGINLLLEWEVGAGDLLSVQLPADPGEQPASVLACVVHVTKLADSRWSIGCTFASELSEDELRRFGYETPGTAPESEQRNRPRHACALEATYALATKDRGAVWPATVLNLSGSGIGLAVAQPITVGELLTVELVVPGERESHTLLCCAVHVTPQCDGEWYVGCNFISELAENDLRALIRV